MTAAGGEVSKREDAEPAAAAVDRLSITGREQSRQQRTPEHFPVLLLSLIFAVNACVVGSVDGVYIHFTSQSLPPSTVVSFQVGVALFNMV